MNARPAMALLSAAALLPPAAAVVRADGPVAPPGARLDAPRPGERDPRPGRPAPPSAPRLTPEGGAGLSPPRPTSRPGAPEEDARGRRDEPWPGPRVELSYQRYVLADGHGGGRVHALGFGGYLPTGAVRLGAWGEGGVRRYALGQDDVLLRANLLVGYQHRGDLAPLVPYVGALGTFGLVLGKRFHTPVRHRIRGAGLEAGLDVNLAGTLWAGVSFAWVRATMRDLAYDLLAVRVRVGL